MASPQNPVAEGPLATAKRKAFWRLLPLCFVCYVIAYVDRANVSLAKLTMAKSMPWLDDAVFGAASSIFFVGYFLLEIPGSLLVERWSARKWISRIMITWGLLAACTALVKTPTQFYLVRFLLGLGEAGFFPGIIIYLSHWFPSRDRARALAVFLVATPTAQMVSPKLTNLFLPIGTTETVKGVVVHHPQLWGMDGWQWVFVGWGLPATVLGIVVLLMLTDRPRDAKWLSAEEREALEAELEREKASTKAKHRMTLLEALRNPKVLLLTLAFFLAVAGNYGIEFFLPSILQAWYKLKPSDITSLVILPPIIALGGQLFVGWSSDRSGERRLHTVVPIVIGACGVFIASQSQGSLLLTIAGFAIAAGGIKAYQPAFWSLPNLFLAESAAAGSIGFINSVGNLGGGGIGPLMMGALKKHTGSFVSGLLVLTVSLLLSATIIFFLGIGKKSSQA